MISFKEGKKKAFWNFVDLNAVRIDKIRSYIDYRVFNRKKFINKVSMIIETPKIKPYHFRGWHEGTSTYLAIDCYGNKFFIKKSRYIEAIHAEVECVNYLNQKCNKKIFEVCDVIGEFSIGNYSYVVETFLEGKPLEDVDYFQNIDNYRKNEICIDLFNVIKEFKCLTFIHGDFTPKNILISAEGKIYIIDFEYSQTLNGEIANRRLTSARKRKLIHLGGEYSMENGIYDDAFSLVQIIRKLSPEFIKCFPNIWREMNLSIGQMQFDIRNLK